MTDARLAMHIRKIVTMREFRCPEGNYDILGYAKTQNIKAFGYKDPVVWELWYPQCQEPVQLRKAEDIITNVTSDFGTFYTINNKEYFVQKGVIIENPRNTVNNKMLFAAQSIPEPCLTSEIGIYTGDVTFITFDKSIFDDQNDAMKRFFIRKLIPALLKLDYIKFGFADLSQNILRPSPPLNTNALNDIREDIALMCATQVHEYI